MQHNRKLQQNQAELCVWQCERWGHVTEVMTMIRKAGEQIGGNKCVWVCVLWQSVRWKTLLMKRTPSHVFSTSVSSSSSLKKQNKTTTSYWSHEIQLINIAEEATIKLNHDLGAALGKNKQWCIYANIQKTLKINK